MIKHENKAARLPKIITEEKPVKKYDLGYGFLGNGITVWNRAKEHDGDHVTVAHIDTNRNVTFYDKDMPHEVKQQIDSVAKSSCTNCFGFVPAPENVPPHIENATIPISVYEAVKRTLPQMVKLKTNAPDPLLPDSTISIADMNGYGYTWDGMLPLTETRALQLFDSNMAVFLLYPDNTEATVNDKDDIINHEGIFGVEADDWKKTDCYKKQLHEAITIEAKLESELFCDSGNRIGIYQIPDGTDEMRKLRFKTLQELNDNDLTVDRANYKLVYTEPLTVRIEFLSARYPVLNYIYTKFNTAHPDDYAGRSVSVSDVIALQYNGCLSFFYVDSKGFFELVNSEFLREVTGKT